MIASAWGEMPVTELEQRIDSIDSSETDDFVALIRLAGFDPARDLRFGDFSKCRFDAQDLHRFDFTGCDLRGASFERAMIETAILDAARIDPGALARAADYPAFLKTDLARPPADRHRLATRRLRDFAGFREAPFAPEMIVLPAGEFRMGSEIAEAELEEDDKAYEDEIAPGVGKRPMRIPERFALGRYLVTSAEYDVFCDATRRKRPVNRHWDRDRRPAIHVSWDEAQAYVAWLNDRLGTSAYRLPSEARWEYACRAATEARRWWGPSWDPARANGARSFEGGSTSPVDHFKPNPWGLHDMIGNVWEWCADEWADNIAGLPKDGAPFRAREGRGEEKKKTRRKPDPSAPRAVRGGSWSNFPRFLRCAVRLRNAPDFRLVVVGFRLSRTL
jgi:formylglycine-generating enzyme required for sulfatase activity